MTGYFPAVALDYDGTITFGPRPDAMMLAALAQVRASSRLVVLVTGRIASELEHDFPDFRGHFDAIVTENGAVVLQGGHERALAPPVPLELDAALRGRGIPFRRGTVILAIDACHDHQVLEICVSLGLDAQLICNRAALMVLPAGVSKASGLLAALTELDTSPHSAVGVGDAENDLALLEACELGVAVGNAVTSLKERADLVLEDIGPRAVARFLTKEFLDDMPGVEPRRGRIPLGVSADGATVTVSASRTHVFIDGPTGAGKSYMAGLLAEGLARAGYTLLVLDMEGDHSNLGELHGVLTLGGTDPLPSPDEVARIIRHIGSSLVLDLSLQNAVVKYAYAREVLERLAQVRKEHGLPHWIFIEEAHMVPSASLDRARAAGNLCLVTYHPEWLPSEAVREADVLITVESEGCARIRKGTDTRKQTCFRPGGRQIAHVRHQHKYAEGHVPFERGFTFRDPTASIGAHVTSLADFAAELGRVPRAVITHHAEHHDFSRWIRDVFQDQPLATAVRGAEATLRPDNVESLRASLLQHLALRYDLEPSSDAG